MTVEVKQMIIKSTVVNKFTEHEQSDGATVDIEQLKEMMMEECKELINESLHELQER